MAIQYYMRGYNTSAPGTVGYVDWVVNDQPDSTATYVPSPYLPSNIINITVNRIVQSKTENFLQPDEGYIVADGYFFHLNSFDWLHASPPTPTIIPPPATYVGIAVTRGGTTNSSGQLVAGASTNFFATLLWDETVQRWKFVQNTNGDHVTLGAYLPVNTGDLTVDGYIAIGDDPAHSGALRLTNGEWIESRNNAGNGDGYLIRYDSSDRVQLGNTTESPTIYIPGHLRVDQYIVDGSANPAQSGFIRNGNNTNIIKFRTALNDNDITALSSQTVETFNNNVVVGDSFNASVVLNTATGSGSAPNGTTGVHKFQINGTTIVEIGTGNPSVNPFVRFDSTATSPTFLQQTTATGNGQNLTVQAQTTTQSGQQGGTLVLSAGDGAGAGTHGAVQIRAGTATPKLTIFPTTAASAADNNSVLLNENLLRFASTELNPSIVQDTAASGTGDVLTVRAQNITTGTGGEVRLSSGSGTAIANAGALNLQTGSINRLTIVAGATAVTGTTTHHVNIEEFDPTVPNPLIRQALAASGTGQTLTLQSQNITTGTGGALVLTSGTGSSEATAGTVDIRTGNNSRQLTTGTGTNTANMLFNVDEFEIVGGSDATTVPNPVWRQQDKTSGTPDGQSFTIQAQTSTVASSIGGDLIISAGDGTIRDGYVRIQTGLQDRVLVTETQTIVLGDFLVLGTNTTVDSTVIELADRVIHVNSTAASYPTATPTPTFITGFSVDRGTIAGPAKRDYYGLFWYELDGYWRFAANTDGYAPGLEQTLAETLPVIASTFLAQDVSATSAPTIPTVGGFRSLNNTVHSASRNNGETADLILVSTDATDHLIWGAGTNNAGHIFDTSVSTLYDFRVNSATALLLSLSTTGTSTIEATATTTAVVYRHEETLGPTGATTTIEAQTAATTGGDLVLTTGAGATATDDGYLHLQTGAVDKVIVHPLYTTFHGSLGSEAYRITPNSSGSTELRATATATQVLYYQEAKVGGSPGAETIIQAQNTDNAGGNLILTSGNGTVVDGYVAIQTGGDPIVTAITDKLIFNKGRRRNITAVTGAATIVDSDDYLAITSLTAPFTINLPATPSLGDEYVIKDTTGNAASFNVTVDGNGNTVDGGASFLFSQPYAAATFTFTGTEWSVT